MDHNEAASGHAVERYFLEEMSPEEKDAFEEHYFTCADCADEVRAAARFRANARDVIVRQREAGRTPIGVFGWLLGPGLLPRLVPAGLCLVLSAAVVYQGAYQVPRLKRSIDAIGPALSFPSFALKDVSRGEEGVTRIQASSPFLTVFFDLPVDAAGKSYICTITNSAGKTMAVIPTAAPKSGETVNLLLNRSHFPSGRYTIDVQAVDPPPGPQPAIPQHKFELN